MLLKKKKVSRAVFSHVTEGRLSPGRLWGQGTGGSKEALWIKFTFHEDGSGSRGECIYRNTYNPLIPQ